MFKKSIHHGYRSKPQIEIKYSILGIFKLELKNCILAIGFISLVESKFKNITFIKYTSIARSWKLEKYTTNMVIYGSSIFLCRKVNNI